ncbi:hypothetical protein SAMN04488074_13826 [Lentzea albidocapillata subsp. violacea]|uniref:Uncharacterized protein n=1 Tax=Lentzea albidocapillata subsp. violacea TaxID=128104 RepID=A0A1G9ZB03_9PSEU|nr:hypothetical protein [Lentzea albidocapillata]SDN18295.1 hypothetical protein SAMN04488074_13826 [Lentzea albidocapillata subsp. violacea]
MNGTARTTHGARGHLSRLTVVLAVLAGLALVVGVQCADGMSMAHDRHELTVERPVAAGMLVALDAPGDSDTGGELAACLMLIVAVIAIVAGLRLPGLRSSAAILRPARAVLAAVVLPRAPGLARLCLLRI